MEPLQNVKVKFDGTICQGQVIGRLTTDPGMLVVSFLHVFKQESGRVLRVPRVRHFTETELLALNPELAEKPRIPA